MTFRVGAVSYLNTKPLIHGLDRALPSAELTLDLPSRLATQLHAGELDVALIPSIELFRCASDDWSIVSDACIACRGPVWSVQLLFRKPPEQVQTLALDEGSRTSAALAQILLKDRCGIRPQLEPLPIGSQANRRLLTRFWSLVTGPCEAGETSFAKFGIWAINGAAPPNCRLYSPCGSRGRTSI